MPVNKLQLPTLLLIFLPLIQGDCLVRRDYMNVRHELKIPYDYDTYSDAYIYGTKIQCSTITLEGNRTLQTYIKPENQEQAKISQLIYIADSTLPVVEAGVFDPYNRIKKLLIGKNGVKSIRPFVFNEMKNLSDIQLYDNELFEIEENTFDGCESLRILNLANNKIKTLKNINVPSLQKLHVDNNLITSINVNDFKSLLALKTLNLSSNSISYLDQNIFTNLKNFTNFYISNNRIGYVPPTLFKNSILNIDLSHNQIKEINCDKFNGIIDLSYNEIGKICKFLNGTDINLSHNKISFVSPDSFKNLNKLKTLDLSYNYIEEVNVNSFNGLVNLTVLNLSNNELSKIYIGTFHSLYDLEELDLSNNNLESFQHGIFTGLANLENLDLTNNKITNLDVKIFYPLTELAILKLRGNYIQSINPISIVNHIRHLRQISLDFGKISCENLMKILNIFREKYIRVDKGNSVKTQNINGIACDPNLHDQTSYDDKNITEIVLTNSPSGVRNYDVSNIANTMANIYSVLLFTCVAFVLFLVIKSVLLIRNNCGQMRANPSLGSWSLKLLNENE